MRPDVCDAARLHDMLSSARLAIDFAQNRQSSDLDKDVMFADATIRRLEIVGEAARNVSKEFKNSHPEIPWNAIVATRNILAHDYDQVNHGVVWRIVQEHLPPLITQLAELLNDIPLPEA